MIALISALWIFGGSATVHELSEWLEYDEPKSLRRLIGRAAEEGFVTRPGRTGRRGGLVSLTLQGWALLHGKFSTPEIRARIRKNSKIFEKSEENK